MNEILGNYGISAQVHCDRSIYRIIAGSHPKILKPLRVGILKAYLTGELLSKRDQGLPVPRLIKPRSGGYYLFHHGNRYLLTEQLQGREADYQKPGDLEAAIRLMRTFHQFGRGVIADNPRRWSLLRFNPVGEWNRRHREMEICREMAFRLQNQWSKQYLRVWPVFNELAQRALQELPEVSWESVETICYHDWAFHNLLIDRERASLFDFDDMLVDHPVHDRVNLIGRYLRLNQWSPQALFRSLLAFDRYYPWRKGDLRLLRLYLTYPYDYWMLGRQYFLEKQPWSLKYYQDQWDRKIAFPEKRELLLDLIRNLE